MSRFGEYSDSGPPRRTRSWRRYGPRVRGASAESSRCGPPALGPGLRGGPVVEAFDQPLVVVAVDELGDHLPGLLKRLEAVEYRHCSFSVRMKRSITPLHCGSPTYDGEIVIPSHFTSLIQASAMYCGPQSQRIANPRATSFRTSPKAWWSHGDENRTGEPPICHCPR
jgi:hypothetical protein